VTKRDVQDPITISPALERLFFAEGLLLTADDLTDEQTYHRARLARMLNYFSGSGTLAGLRVAYQPAETFPSDDEQILVYPGLAVDRLGRMIELPRSACLRLGRWYHQQADDDLNRALFADPFNGVVADLFISFVVCEVGKTPAFASGPFDALDAVAPGRLSDGYELKLVLRTRSEGNPPPLPRSRWPRLNTTGTAEELAQSVADLKNAVLDSWPRDNPVPENPEPPGEYPLGMDQTAVFLARIVIAATANAVAGAAPERVAPTTEPDPGGGDPIVIQPVLVDNLNRQFIFPTRALAHQFATLMPEG
jgi:hypothetical protein